MRSPLLLRTSAFLVASILWIATSASAGDLEGLAPPGACAEPREAVAGSAVPGSEADSVVSTASAMAVVGSLQSFFNPSDVAAAPEATPQRPAPAGVAAAVRYPGACESGGSACQREFQPSVADVPPIIPGTRPGRGMTSYPGAPPVGENPAIVPGARPARP